MIILNDNVWSCTVIFASICRRCGSFNVTSFYVCVFVKAAESAQASFFTLLMWLLQVNEVYLTSSLNIPVLLNESDATMNTPKAKRTYCDE